MLPSKGPDISRSTPFRPDLEGLRGVAVLAVFANHLFGAPVGGFAGVDLFFVLSGFLITGILIRERDTTGQIDLVAFLVRRARRILPAALVVIAVVSAAAAALWHTPRALAVTLDALASLSFVENWHLVATRTAYLQGDGGESPLEHFWSLGVEEQFYAFWPLLLIATGLATRRLGRGRSTRLSRAVTPVAIGAILVASLSFAAWRSSVDQNAAYFDTGARVWELAAGALAATLAPLAARLAPRSRQLLSTAGLIGIALSLLAPVAPRHYPWPVAVLPVGAAVLLLLFPPRGGSRLARVLDNRPIRLTGRISYSLYLWHFPVIVFVRSLLGTSPVSALLTIALAALLAALSYRFVEQPALRHARTPERRPARISGSPRAPRRRLQIATAALVLVVIGTATTLQRASVPELTSTEAAAAATDLLGKRESARDLFGPSSLESLITAGLSDATWPSTIPSLDHALDNQYAPGMSLESGCLHDVTTQTTHTICSTSTPGATKTAVVLGDSMAISYLPMINQALAGRGWRVVGLGFSSCPLIDAALTKPGLGTAFTDGCAHARKESLALVDDLDPELVILSGHETAPERLESPEPRAGAGWSSATERLLRTLADADRQVVLLGSPPMGPPITNCATRFSSPRQCEATYSAEHSAKDRAEKAAADRVAAAGHDVRFISTESWFCSGGRCPAQIGETLVRIDDSHLTNAMSEALGAVARDVLLRAPGADPSV